MMMFELLHYRFIEKKISYKFMKKPVLNLTKSGSTPQTESPSGLSTLASKIQVTPSSRTSVQPSPGVEVKALCPAWADTEIVSGANPEHKVVTHALCTFIIGLLQDHVNSLVKKHGGMMTPEYVAQCFYR